MRKTTLIKDNIVENLGYYPAMNGNAGATVNAILASDALSPIDRERVLIKSARLTRRILWVVNRVLPRRSGPVICITALSHCIMSIQDAMLEDSDWKKCFDEINQQYAFLTPKMGGNDEGNKGYA